jgi:hypothetical protein
MAARLEVAPGGALRVFSAWGPRRASAIFARIGLSLVLCLGACEVGHAAALRYCDAPAELSARQQDTLLRFSGLIKAELERGARPVALVSRSGLDLSRFDLRYSHAGLSLQAGEGGAWSVRQLYYDCEAKRPQIFDQGLSGFVVGTDNPKLGYVSLVFLPDSAARELEAAALDKRRALEVLASTYSANAYAFGTRYQNCNQWVAELMASAWGGAAEAPLEPEGAPADASRRAAQRWLADQGFAPTRFEVGWRVLMWAGQLLPWLHDDDHPAEDLAALRYHVSMPASIESFLQRRWPGAERVELCHTEQHMVVHRGWAPLAEGCVPGPEDTVLALD